MVRGKGRGKEKDSYLSRGATKSGKITFARTVVNKLLLRYVDGLISIFSPVLCYAIFSLLYGSLLCSLFCALLSSDHMLSFSDFIYSFLVYLLIVFFFVRTDTKEL